jgi:hypothetical protein
MKYHQLVKGSKQREWWGIWQISYFSDRDDRDFFENLNKPLSFSKQMSLVRAISPIQ